MKVYKISVGDYFYYGSTKCELKERLRTHTRDLQRYDNKLYSKIKEIGWENVKIELMKECENGREEEDKLIAGSLSNMFCLNERRATPLDKKEYNEKYFNSLPKEKLAEYAKRTYQKHLEENRERRRKYSQAHAEERKKKAKEWFANLTREQRDEINRKKREARTLKKMD
jgi:hypothetical protein